MIIHAGPVQYSGHIDVQHLPQVHDGQHRLQTVDSPLPLLCVA
jgi:hypothetical protein